MTDSRLLATRGHRRLLLDVEATRNKSERDLIPACVHVLHGMRDHKRNRFARRDLDRTGPDHNRIEPNATDSPWYVNDREGSTLPHKKTKTKRTEDQRRF